MTLFTIGHGSQHVDRLIHLLKQNGIAELVDVRSSPYSRFHPQFNRETLETELTRQGVEYVYAGDQLGGRPADPTCYKRRESPGEEADFLHEVDYPQVMTRSWFREGIARLLALADARPTAILCSEEDPAHCHRHHLIARYLLAEHPAVDVQHIRGDGTVFPARTLLASVDEPPSEQLPLF